jgi:cytochrome P450
MNPTYMTISLRDPKFDEDRYGTIERMRAQNFFSRTPEGHVVFLSQEDAVEVFRCKDFRFTFSEIDEHKSPYLANAIEHELLNMHGAQHERLSRLLKRALRERVIDGIEESISTIVDDLIDSIPDDGVIDFCTGFSDPLPARVLGPMFGVPYEETAGLNDWIRIGGRKSDALQSGLGISEVEDANRKLHDYLRSLLKQRQKSGGNDLFSELMLVEIDGDRLTEDELVYLAGELAAAGVDTTRAQLPLILNALLDHPSEMRKLRADPNLSMRAVDEGMRFAPLPWAIPHSATRDFEYKGIAFKEGDLAFALVPAANRDPAVIPEPNTFNITRDRVRNFAFGHGMHVCPGIRLARMEMSIALRKFIERVDTVSLAGEPQWVPGQKLRTMTALPLAVRKRFALA